MLFRSVEILDRKSTDIASFFLAMDELLNTIGQALKNRTPHLNGEKILSNRDVCQMLHISSRTLQDGGIQAEFLLFRLRAKPCISSLKY